MHQISISLPQTPLLDLRGLTSKGREGNRRGGEYREGSRDGGLEPLHYKFLATPLLNSKCLFPAEGCKITVNMEHPVRFNPKIL